VCGGIVLVNADHANQGVDVKRRLRTTAFTEMRCNNTGFTLLEIVIAVAIVAIMAGTIMPLAFRELMSARADAIDNELKGYEQALTEFYEDTGRFPSEAEGLPALVVDPGVTNWQGPYVGNERGDPTTEVTTDAFGNTYIYDLQPTTDPAGGGDLLVASAGVDQNIDSGGLNSTWALTAATDDQLMLLSLAPINREKDIQCRQELDTIGVAARDYFQDNAAFPTNLGSLIGTYLDAGVGNAALIDSWNSAYVLVLSGAGTPSPSLTLRSYGPDRTDDSGGDDDISLLVSSIPPGRTTSLFRLDVTQAALNGNPNLPLTGSWTGASGIRASLGLSSTFDNDGWGSPLAVNALARVVYSVGPDGNAVLTIDNLPAGVGP